MWLCWLSYRNRCDIAAKIEMVEAETEEVTEVVTEEAVIKE